MLTQRGLKDKKLGNLLEKGTVDGFGLGEGGLNVEMVGVGEGAVEDGFVFVGGFEGDR